MHTEVCTMDRALARGEEAEVIARVDHTGPVVRVDLSGDVDVARFTTRRIGGAMLPIEPGLVVQAHEYLCAFVRARADTTFRARVVADAQVKPPPVSITLPRDEWEALLALCRGEGVGFAARAELARKVEAAGKR